MRRLPTALLRHETATGGHYDWLIATPDDPLGALWCARVSIASRHWGVARVGLLQPLPPHRRRYLSHQGPIGAGRGGVRRVDRGRVMFRLHRATRWMIRIEMAGFVGEAELTPAARSPASSWWRVVWTPSPDHAPSPRRISAW